MNLFIMVNLLFTERRTTYHSCLSFQEEVYWESYGTPSDIKNILNINDDRTRVSAECGGYCGGCRPHNGKLGVELDQTYCPQEGIKCKTIVVTLCNSILDMCHLLPSPPLSSHPMHLSINPKKKCKENNLSCGF